LIPFREPTLRTERNFMAAKANAGLAALLPSGKSIGWEFRLNATGIGDRRTDPLTHRQKAETTAAAVRGEDHHPWANWQFQVCCYRCGYEPLTLAANELTTLNIASTISPNIRAYLTAILPSSLTKN
jgi:hypothetical protein